MSTTDVFSVSVGVRPYNKSPSGLRFKSGGGTQKHWKAISPVALKYHQRSRYSSRVEKQKNGVSDKGADISSEGAKELAVNLAYKLNSVGAWRSPTDWGLRLAVGDSR